MTLSTQKSSRRMKSPISLEKCLRKTIKVLPKEYSPSSIKKLFTEEETSIASKKLRNGKSPGIGNMYTEYIKYAQRNHPPENR